MVRIFDEEKLLVASGNEGKVREIQELFAPYGVQMVSASAFGLPSPAEDGVTFCDNAEIKARYYGKKTGLPALADDSGLVIPAISGQPGVYSARWAGPNQDFGVAIDRVRETLKAARVPLNCPAYFISALSLYWPDGDHIETFEGRVDGHLTFPAKGKQGFGYDPIFVPEGFTLSFGEMSSQEKQKISHRARAFELLIGACFIRESA